MVPAGRFAGFESQADEANVMVVEIAGPRTGIIGGFRDEAKLSAQRMELLGVDKIRTGAGETELFRLKQRHAGSVYFKYTMALGDEKNTALITAMAEEDVHDKWKDLLLKSLASARLGEKKGSITGFAIDPKGDLKEARAVSNMMLFTVGGELPAKDKRGPMFLGSRSIAPMPPQSLAEFAEARAKTLNGVKELTITSSKATTLDGLEGWELVGSANDSTPAEALSVYEVILKEVSGGYFILLGIGPKEKAAEHLAAFRAMSATFRKQ